MDYMIMNKRRNTGQCRVGADEMATALKLDEKVFIASCKENYAIDRYIDYFKKEHDLTVTYTRMTRMEPEQGWRPIYDRYAEIIGIEPVEQKEVFIGWMLIKANNS